MLRREHRSSEDEHQRGIDDDDDEDSYETLLKWNLVAKGQRGGGNLKV